jgi:hypothetical protein
MKHAWGGKWQRRKFNFALSYHRAGTYSELSSLNSHKCNFVVTPPVAFGDDADSSIRTGLCSIEYVFQYGPTP